MKEYRRETGAEIHDTVIKIRDDASLASACKMIDKMLERYEQEREEANARRREMRRKKRESRSRGFKRKSVAGNPLLEKEGGFSEPFPET